MRLTDVAEAPERDSDDDRYYLFQAVADFLRRASARQPLLVTLEDVHWVDPSSVRLLKFMASALETARIALVATYRTEELDETRAIECATTFAQRVRSEAGFFRRVMQLRGQVQAGDEQRVRALLGDCFGFSRTEAQEVMLVLRRRLRLEN